MYKNTNLQIIKVFIFAIEELRFQFIEGEKAVYTAVLERAKNIILHLALD